MEERNLSKKFSFLLFISMLFEDNITYLWDEYSIIYVFYTGEKIYRKKIKEKLYGIFREFHRNYVMSIEIRFL